MNIAIINSHGMQKSTGKLAYNLLNHLLNKKHNALLYCGRKMKGDIFSKNMHCVCTKFERYLYALIDRIFGTEGLNAYTSTYKLVRKLKKQSPDVVYLMNLHAYYINIPMLFKYLEKHRTKVIYVLYDEFAFTGKCCFTYDCEKFINVCNKCNQLKEYPKTLFFDNSTKVQSIKKHFYTSISDITFVGVEYTIKKAKMAYAIPSHAKFVIADEGVDLENVFYPRDAKMLKNELGIDKNQIVILTVSPFSNVRKGGKYFLETAKIMENNDKYVFVYVGYDGDIEECPANLIPIKYVYNQDDLAEYYSLADLFLCTSLAETIPNTCIEALSCGVPILGFDISGIPTCSDEAHGVFIEAGDTNALVEQVLRTVRKDEKIIKSCRDYAKTRFDSLEYSKKLEELIY